MPKEEEIDAFTAFCESTALVTYQDFAFQDAPDFVNADKSLGIELVSYHRDASTAGEVGSLRRSGEVRLERMIAEAKAHCLNRGGARFDVYVFPRGRTSLDMPPGAAEDLVDLVVAHVEGRTEMPVAPLSEVVAHIMVGPTAEHQADAVWQVASADFVDADPRAVQSILDDKERLVQRYRERVGVVWLLIYGSRMPCIGAPQAGRWSTCGRVTGAMKTSRFRSTFDRVYYLDQDEPNCVQLVTERDSS